MFPIEKAFWKLLNKNITYKNLAIPLIRKLHQMDKTPCVFIHQANEYCINKQYVEINNIQYLRKRFNCSIWIQVFANNENERSAILKSIEDRISQAETNHYTTCENYDKVTSNCNYLNRKCDSLTIINGRTVKKQCPYPKDNNYSSFFKTNNIIKNTFKEEEYSNLDELEKNPPLLRSVLKFSMDYYKYQRIGGEVYDSFKISGDLI